MYGQTYHKRSLSGLTSSKPEAELKQQVNKNNKTTTFKKSPTPQKSLLDTINKSKISLGYTHRKNQSLNL